MEMRNFGATGLAVSSLGIGCARIGGIFQQDAASFVRVLRTALDAGINFFDTADMYSQGESEKLLGRALSGARDRAVIATKAGFLLPARRRLIARAKPLVRPLIRALGLRRVSLPASVRGAPTQDFSPGHLRRAVEGSLRRLRTDRIDLFQLHSPPTAVIERGDWLPVLQRLQGEGKILHYGVACDTSSDGLVALRHPGISSLQVTINLLERGAVDLLLPAAREKNVAVIARECLANGLLVKDAASVDLRNYCSTPEELERRQRQLTAVRELAARNRSSLPELSLRFVQRLAGVSVALIGVRTREQLEGLLRLPQGEPLSAETLRALPV